MVKMDMVENEEKQLFDFMNTCQNSALILPDYMCLDFLKRLAKKNHVHAFIGKEVYTNMTLGFSVHGYIPNMIQMRIKSIQTSGIFRWWGSFIESQYFFVASDAVINYKPQKPAMKGNVLLVFLVLIIGLVVSLLYFIYELKTILLRQATMACFAMKSCYVIFSVVQQRTKESRSDRGRGFALNRERLNVAVEDIL